MGLSREHMGLSREPILEATDLYRFFHAGEHETLALRGVSLTVEAGEIVAVTGPSGSGKSTLLACLAGLDEPDGGMVRVAGQALSRRPEVERAKLRARHIGMLFQNSNLIEHLSIEANVALVQQLAGHPSSNDARALLDELGIGHRRNARPSQLSGGEAVRAGLAVTLANGPELILADEPTGELDSHAADAVMALLRERAATGAAIVIVTHSAAVAAGATRRISMRDGRIVGGDGVATRGFAEPGFSVATVRGAGQS